MSTATAGAGTDLGATATGAERPRGARNGVTNDGELMYEFPRVRWIRSQDFGPRSTETTAEELGTGGGVGTRNGRRRNERNESPGRDGSRPRSATPRWPEGRRREAETRRDEEGGMPGLGTLLGEGAASRRPGAGIGKSERVLG